MITLGPSAWPRIISPSQDSSLITSSKSLSPRKATYSPVSGVRTWESFVGEALFYLPSHPSMYLSICSFTHSSSCHLPTYALSIHWSSQPASPAFVHLSFYPSFYPPMYPFVYLPPPSIHLIIRPLSISPSLSANFGLSFPSCVRPSIHPSTHMHICPSVCPDGAGCQRRVRESRRMWWGQRVGPQPSQTLPGSVFLFLTAQLLPGTTSCHHRPPNEWLPLPHPPTQSGAS